MDFEAICHHWETLMGDEGDPVYRHLVNPTVLRLLGDVAEKRVLDAGCGNGHLTWQIAKLGADVTAVDLSINLLAYARGRAERRGVSIHLERADLSRLQYDDSSFDAVVASMTLQFVERYEDAISEMARVLKPGGRLIVSISHPCFDVSEKETAEKGKNRENPQQERNRSIPIVLKGEFSGLSYRQECRTLSEYLNAFTGAGFFLRKCVEPRPTDALIAEDARTWERLARTPPVLCLAFEKPAGKNERTVS
jgi:ubiquinone/menaquinone biosynthesis C-methylase UbiE